MFAQSGVCPEWQNPSVMKRIVTMCLLGALMGLLCPEMNAQFLHTPTGCNSGSTSSQLNFSTTPSGTDVVDWLPAGSTSQTFSNVAGSGTDMKFTVSGNISSLTNNPGAGLSPSVTGYYSGGVEALGLITNGVGVGNHIVITVNFAPALPGELAFDIFHINQSGSSGDHLAISAATTTGATIFPNFTTPLRPDYVITGPGQIDANNFSSVAAGQLGVNFSSADSISQLTIDWEDCLVCGNSRHGIALAGFEFCQPINDNDGDGIPDDIDLDDDNDGIPDVMEICGTTPTNPDKDTVGISILLDGYPDETSWELQTVDGVLLAGGGPYNRATDIGTTISAQAIVPADESTIFTLHDSYGDALVSSPRGNYSVTYNGATLVGPIVSNWGALASENIIGQGAPYNPFACIGSDYAADDDGDGIPNYQDPDFCTLNAHGVCSNLDSDGDGVIDPFDLDADNDGIPDLVEAGGVDTDGNGIVDDLTDTDTDGLADVYDEETGGTAISNPDSDGDGVADFLDLDADNDGILDVVEAGGTDVNNDGQQDGVDADGDGFADPVDGDVGNDGIAENTGNGLMVTGPDTNGDGTPDFYATTSDFDGDGIPNFLDLDSDNDGIVDHIEAQGSGCYQAPSSVVDVNGVPVNFAPYTNCADNSTATTYGTTPNMDNDDPDNQPDYLDLDSDDDGLYDFVEGVNQNANVDSDDECILMANSFGPINGSIAVYDNTQDTDGDGIPNWLDNQPTVPGNNTTLLPPFQDPGSAYYFDTDQDGIVDLLDTHNGGSPIAYPYDINNDADPDWRDQGNLLPIELTSFDAQLMDGQHGQILWETQKERGTSHFNVLRSTNGQDFARVSTVNGAGNSDGKQAYQVIDHNIADLNTEIVYYQLEEVDVDGNVWHSEIEMLLMAETGGLNWEVYPNPFHDKVRIDLNGDSNSLEISLYSADMKQLWSETHTISGEMTIEKELSSLAKGLYVMKARLNGQDYIRKIVKR